MRHNPDFISDEAAISQTVAINKEENPHLSKADARAEVIRRLGGPSNADQALIMQAIDDAYPDPAPAAS